MCNLIISRGLAKQFAFECFDELARELKEEQSKTESEVKVQGEKESDTPANNINEHLGMTIKEELK